MRIILLAVAALILAAGNAWPQASNGMNLALAAESQVGVTKLYDPAYRRLAYPGGDVPMERGVCSDVVIRAFRSIGIDLQLKLHEDMRRNFRTYPQLWKLTGPDRNIDHRRVPNLMKWFERQTKALSTSTAFEPGDVVAWRLPGGLHHIGVVSTQRAPGQSHYLVVHNIGQGAQVEDILHAYEKLGHYRW